MATSPLRLAAPSPQLLTAPTWRREPYLLFFPLGALLAWAGVLPWLFFSVGATGLYRPMFDAIGYRAAFHPIAQVEGFLTCFAVGFLFTFLPRRTGTAPPTWWEMALALAAPVVSVVFAWFERWLLAQISWIALLGLLIGFVVRRAGRVWRRTPPSFVWVAAGLAMGGAGAVLAGIGATLDNPSFWLHLVGRGLLLQGLFTGLVLGIGGLLLPAITRGVDKAATLSPRGWAYALHALLAAAFAATFFLEYLVSVQAAYALRAAISLAVVIGSLEALQPPTLPGFHRRVARWSVWMLPAGYLWVAVAPNTGGRACIWCSSAASLHWCSQSPLRSVCRTAPAPSPCAGVPGSSSPPAPSWSRLSSPASCSRWTRSTSTSGWALRRLPSSRPRSPGRRWR